MSLRLRNFEGMLAELQKLTYDNKAIEFEVLYDEGITEDRIVYLYNIYCMPAKWEVGHVTYNSSRKRKTK